MRVARPKRTRADSADASAKNTRHHSEPRDRPFRVLHFIFPAASTRRSLAKIRKYVKMKV